MLLLLPSHSPGSAVYNGHIFLCACRVSSQCALEQPHGTLGGSLQLCSTPVSVLRTTTTTTTQEDDSFRFSYSRLAVKKKRSKKNLNSAAQEHTHTATQEKHYLVVVNGCLVFISAITKMYNAFKNEKVGALLLFSPLLSRLGSSPEPLRKLLLYDGWRVEEKNNVWERIFSGAAILAYFASIPLVLGCCFFLG